jgi:hypothetical protein
MEQEVKYVRIYVERLHKLYLESANEHLEKHKLEDPLLITSREYHLTASKEYLNKAQALGSVLDFING